MSFSNLTNAALTIRHFAFQENDVRKLAVIFLAGIAAMAATAPTQAAVGISCSLDDINPGATDCSGFVLGNATGGQQTNPSAALLLSELGYTGSVDGIETIENLSGITKINFNTLLVGQTIIGVHYGNGAGSPGADLGKKGNGDGGDTAFYLFDAGTGLDTFNLNFGASSNVRLYQTSAPAVPEPTTWMLMLIGMAGVGFSMRSKRDATLRVRFA